MTVDTLTNRVSYQGNGSTDEFSFPAKFFADADLKVLIRDETDEDNITETLLVLDTDYEVTGAGEDAGGTVTILGSAPTADQKVIIYRDPALLQDLDLVPNDKLPVEEIEKRLDKLTMIAQRLDERMDRAVAKSEGFVATFDPTLPLEPVASSVLGYNAAANGFEVGPTFDEVSNAQGYAEDASDSADAAAASATAAASSQSAAATSATAAATSATAAATSATAAAASATTASTQATNAATSATAAATSETNAAASATTASTQATNAAASATAAAGSATTASTQATNASTSATNAAASATAAAASATSAATDAAATLFRWGGTSGGSADTQTLTPSPALGAYGNGVRYVFIAGFTNTGACTINISGLGAKSLKTTGGAALAAGNITSGNMYTITYDGTNFRVHELVAVAAGSITATELATDAVTAIKILNATITAAKMAAGNTGVWNPTAKTANYTAVAGDLVNCTANSFNVTLPTAVGVSGQPIRVVNSGTGTITILTTSSQTINGASSGEGFTVYPGDSFEYVSDNANWTRF